MLTVLGVTAAEDTVYGRLLAAVSASEDELAASTGLSQDDVRSSIESLIERGLVARMAETPSRFVAASPSVIESMISERLAELREAQLALDGLTSRYRANHFARTVDGVFEVVRGEEALRDCSLRLLQSARAEVLNFVKPPLIALQPDEGIGPGARVRNRIIYETSALENGMLAAVREGLLVGDEARAHTKLPVKMLAVDQSVALLPLAQHDTTPVGVLLHESALLEALLTLFEYVWAAAIPLHVYGESNGGAQAAAVLSDEGRELLSLLLAGLSDEAIAMHRDLSVRTVQRKVHALMDIANVRTRMQLAWEAARRGWL
jgi:sugar-specific transcriptional regulator TrmB/DNA-binding CsgD family transcriptional regulator